MTAAAGGGALRGRVAAAALAAAIAALPMTWVPLVSLGGFDLTLAYAGAVALGAAMLPQLPRALAALGRVLRAGAPWLLPYALYVVVLAAHLAGLPDNGMILRQAFFALCGLSVATALVLAGADARAVRRGGLLAVAVFLGAFEYLARQAGTSWLEAASRFASGDLAHVLYRVIRPVMAAAAGGDADVAASLKNAASAGLLAALILLRAGHRGPGPDRAGQAATVLVLAVLVMLGTRSVILMAAVALPVAAAVAAVRHPRPSAHGLIARGAVLVLAAVAITVAFSSGGPLSGAVGDRFAFSDASTGARVQQAAFAVAGIERSVLVGSGLREVGGQLVHNLFLGAWLHGGLLAFLLVTGAYVALVGAWARAVTGWLLRPASWTLPLRAEWVAVLPLPAFFRVWVAGDAGHPGFPEWISLLAFTALVAANARARPAPSRAPSGMTPA